MENPEEVLQALDEFQKMRPSEIPRELEEYLSWVAKTGDPVFQWSLVKPLFREKLTRVMTDFYESFPSLELAPCPNVEQFNYDIMKCNLLELLESFANAPFTVQRICELLTSPRKQYNRVDKFMRAIEKNILVVSTIEPGPAARRSENGDGMVNGSLDEETPTQQQEQASHEVEMESWVKDCTTESSASITSSDVETPLIETVMPVVKIAKDNEEISQKHEGSQENREKSEPKDNDSEDSAENSISPVENNEEVGLRVEHLSGNGTETVVTASKISEAVMNEDTSSQPSLDAETEESDSANSRKLQTTFRTKDFVKKDDKSVATYEELSKGETEKRRLNEEPEIHANTTESEVTMVKSTEEVKSSFVDEETEIPIVEAPPEKRPRIDKLIDDLETIATNRDEETDVTSTKEDSPVVDENTADSANFSITSIATKSTESSVIDEKTIETPVTSDERLSSCENEKIEEDEDEEEEEETRKEETTDSADDSLPEADRTVDTTENSKPIVEEPSFDEIENETGNKTLEPSDNQESGVTIEETMDDDTTINKSIIPDPLPIVEEPKENEPTVRDSDDTTVITELTEITKSSSESMENSESREAIGSISVVEETSTIVTVSEEITSVQDSSQEDMTDVRCSEETATIDEKIEPAESMEVDGEESLTAFQQDEPMEQEAGDMVKS